MNPPKSSLHDLTAAEFGTLIAKEILRNPESKYWALVSRAVTGDPVGGLDWDETKPLLERIAGAPVDG